MNLDDPHFQHLRLLSVFHCVICVVAAGVAFVFLPFAAVFGVFMIPVLVRRSIRDMIQPPRYSPTVG